MSKPKQRVLKFVSGSYKVTLPINMVEELDLKDGDTIEFNRVGKKITIKKV